MLVSDVYKVYIWIMSKTAVVTARVSEETLALLDSIAARHDRSRAWVIARAVESHAQKEAEFLAFVQKGIDDLDAGRKITHDELIDRIKARQSRKAA
jgi:predicted transcriptional regulator